MTRRFTGRTGRGLEGFWATAVLAAVLTAGALGGFVLGSQPAVAGSTGPRPLGDPGSGWIPDVRVTQSNLVDRRPSLATDAAGDLLMAYESAAAGNYDIMFTESVDGGLTWSAPVALASTATDEVNPSIATDPASGRIFVAYQAGTIGTPTIWVAYSDDGVTWTPTVVLACPVYCERPRIVSEYWNGAGNRQYVVFAGEVTPGTDWDWLLYRSTNQGAAWTWLYESGNVATDFRHQPVVTVQHGTDGTDRIFVFYRYGATYPGTLGNMEWSTDYGVTWNGPSLWAGTVNSPPAIAAAHDGSSLMIAYASNANNIMWAVDPSPTDPTWGTGTFSDQWLNAGNNVALGVDGDGSTSLAIGGSYRLIARSNIGGDIVYASAPVALTGQADWTPSTTPLTMASDSAAAPSVTYSDKSVTTTLRGGAWWPAIAWTDFRNGVANYDVDFTTPGSTYTIDTAPPGLQVEVDGVPNTAPVVATWLAGTIHSVNAPSPQMIAADRRYTWTNWSDGGTRSHTFTVGGATTTVTARFLTEYLLTLNSVRAGVTGAGWYLADTTATIGASSPQAGPPGERYAFAAWTGDLLSSATSVLVVMNEPKVINAVWRTEYQLTVVSAHGNVTQSDPTGWYLANEDATITVAAREVAESGKTWEFLRWSGDASGTATAVTVKMTGPMSVTARWREKPGIFADSVSLAVLLGLLFLVVLVLILGIIMRRRRKQAPSFQQMHAAPGIGAVGPAPPTEMPPQQPPQPWPPQGPPTGPPP